MEDFVHLHVHSEYSLLDGAARVDDLVAQAVALGQKAIAVTDHGCMYGVVAFYKACQKAGIKPIIGMEAYVSPRKLDDKLGKMDKEYAHLILLAKNEKGYQNLVKLSSMAFLQGYYYRPRIDYQVLDEYGEGLIVMTACLSGDLPRLLMDGRFEDALNYVRKLKARFGDDFYIEMQDHGIPEERAILPQLLEICRIENIKPVCTNDVHYVKKEDAQAQDVLLCIQTGRFVDEENRMKMTGSEFYLKSADEMALLFPSCPESLENTNEIAGKCQVDFEFGKIHLPHYQVPEENTHEQYLRQLCETGLAQKFARFKLDEEVYKERLNYELRVIEEMGYVDYFLIVWDFIDYAKRKEIMVGPGRGSAAGSLVAFTLGITDIDPIRYGLIFERFLNPERITMPDIDIDFCYERRQEVIDYVVEKYGNDHVAQIITFGTMGAKQAIRDVGRVLRVPYGDVDKLAKMIPFELNITIDRAMEINKELREAYDSGGSSQQIIDLARRIEGMPRHSSTHAAGVVISAFPLDEYVPLQKNDEAITTQFPMGTIEELGLLKMDFLGLRTLTVIRDTLAEIKRQGEEVPDLDTIPDNDAAVYQMISAGQTDGVFQLESSGMRAFLQQFQPDCFEDIIAGISLYRPGPMDQIPMYVERKFHPEKVRYDHPMLEPILHMTYGCMVYQEQVMQIVRDLAGYSLGRSDLVRRAMSKKKKDVMEKEESAFVEGCSKNGISEQIAKKIFASMMDFAQYAFNKSHAAAYAVIAYRTGWLKKHYEPEFLSSLMNSFLSSTDKITEYIHSCKKSGVLVLSPDINKSMAKFCVEKQGDQKAVRFGLGAIKHVGMNACESIVIEREKNGLFTDFYDFLTRCSDFLSKRFVEYLIKAGVFDGFGMKRSVLMTVHASMMDGISEDKKRNIAGQVSLFELSGQPKTVQAQYPDLPEFDQKQMLSYEKEATGLYISGHPLDEFAPQMQKMQTSRDLHLAGELESLFNDQQFIKLGGVVMDVKRKLTRNNDQMAYVQMEDLFGTFECVVFPRTLTQYQLLLHNDAVLYVKGRINVKDDENVLIAQEFGLLTEYPSENGQKLIDRNIHSMKKETVETQNIKPDIKPGLYLRCNRDQMNEMIRFLSQNTGEHDVIFVCDGKALLSDQVKTCAADEATIYILSQICGQENVKLVGTSH